MPNKWVCNYVRRAVAQQRRDERFIPDISPFPSHLTSKGGVDVCDNEHEHTNLKETKYENTKQKKKYYIKKERKAEKNISSIFPTGDPSYMHGTMSERSERGGALFAY